MEKKEKILYYFKEISKIPRESGKEKQVSDYLVNFAKERELEVVQDKYLNVIIKKKATSREYEKNTVILQGHMDMVYVKKENSEHVYEEGIEVLEEDGYLYAEGTSLGGDNGVALAYILTLLDSDDIEHPNIEAIITTEEEVGLVGAQNIDCSLLQGKYMINLDAENEGVFFTSCAGGVRNNFIIPLDKEVARNTHVLCITISGLKGGHSGVDINEGRGNAIKLMARFLNSINDDEVNLVSIECEGKANAIPALCQARIGVSPNNIDGIKKRIKEIEGIYKVELQFTDTIDIDVCEEAYEEEVLCYISDCKNRVISALSLMPYGILGMSYAIENLVETSINIGSVEEQDNKLIILSSIRSSVASQKEAVVENINTIAKLIRAESECFNNYPQWQYSPNSKLRDMVFETYEDMYHKKPISTAIHAGLECGYFDSKIEGVDIISFGADLMDVHTYKEKARVESIYNIWDLIVEILRRMVEL